MLLREVVLWQLKYDGKESEDFRCYLQRPTREVLDLWMKLAQVWMERLLFVRWDELWDIDRFHVIKHIAAHDLLLMRCTISKVVSFREIASVLWIALLFDRNVEIRLANVVLSVNLFLGETSADYTEETGVMDLKASVRSPLIWIVT